jgi:tetratricopeptide (TPR) repeat protein
VVLLSQGIAMAGKPKAAKPKAAKLSLRERRDLLDQAQDIVYQAWETSSRKKRIVLATKALEISPDCADAYVIMAEMAPSLDETLELYRKGVEAGERALGKKAFTDDAGYFWGILETRPYMRARAGLARSLWESNRRDEAVEHYRALLHLNPNDNQGIRYVLASCLLELNRDDEAAKLLDQYPDDAAATWSWTAALLAFRQHGNSAGSRSKLAAALETNPHVPAFLLGKKKLPRALPGLVGFGDESEAIDYAAENQEVWQATPGALAWLADRINAAKPAILH